MEKVQKEYKGIMPKLNVSFGDGYIKQSGEATVYVITRVGKQRMRFNTGVSISGEYWDDVGKQVRKNHPQYKDYNLLILATQSRLTEIFTRYRLQYRELTAPLLRKEYRIFAKHIDFHQYLEHAIKERQAELTFSSIKQHNVLRMKLKEFSPSLSFSELDEDLLVRFNRWMINTKKNSANTRHNAFKNLKVYLNIAKQKRLIDVNPLEHFSPVKQVTTERAFLDENEIRSLQLLYARLFLNDRDQRILRHFLFMCFTGLRISDLKAVKMEDIVNGILVFTAYKTRSRKPATTKIPICRYAQRLVKDESPHRLHGFVFSCYSEQLMRSQIKEIIKAAGINKDISLHTARHTFATLFLRRTRNIAALQKLLGHTKIEMTMVYAHILTEDVEEEIHRAFDDF